MAFSKFLFNSDFIEVCVFRDLYLRVCVFIFMCLCLCACLCVFISECRKTVNVKSRVKERKGTKMKEFKIILPLLLYKSC